MTDAWEDTVTATISKVDGGLMDFNVIETPMENRNKVYALRSAEPARQWRLIYEFLTQTELNEIYLFFVAQSGRMTKFYWKHPHEFQTANGAGAPDTTLVLNGPLPVRAGDLVYLPTGDHNREISAVSADHKTLTIASGTWASGDEIRPVYTVRFAEMLDWSVMKSWIKNIEIVLEADI